MKFFTGYRKAMSWVEKIVMIFLMALLFSMFLISTTEVFRRYILGKSFVWADELCRYMLVYIAFLGGSLAFKKGNLVYFDLIQSRLSPTAKLLFNMMTNTVSLAFGVFLVIRGYQFAFSPVLLRQLSMGLKIPMATMYASVPIGFALLVLFSIDRYIEIIQHYQRREAN